MSEILGANGHPIHARPTIPDPTAGTAADYFHRVAVAAAMACDEETRPARELGVLAGIAQHASMMRDLLTARSRGRISRNEVYSYQLVGLVDASDARGAVEMVAETHEAAEAEMSRSSLEDGARSAAHERAYMLRMWISLTDDVPRRDQRRAAALWATLASNLIQKLPQTGPELLPHCMYLSAEAAALACLPPAESASPLLAL